MSTAQKATAREVLLGVRLVELVLANALMLALCAAAGGAIGFALTLGDERRFVTAATVEVGVRYLKEPLESPLVAAERLGGHLAEAARGRDPGADISVQARRDPATRALLRYLDVTVAAKTASAAVTVANRGIDTFIAEQHQLYAYERAILDKERAYYERWTDKLEAVLDDPTAPSTPGDARDLGEALFETERLIHTTAAMVSEFRMRPTRVLARPYEPGPEPSRVRPMVLGGALLGLGLGAVIAMLRRIARGGQ